MKSIKELKLEEMTTEQKLGFVNVVTYHGECSAETEEFIFSQIKNRALGAIWIQLLDDNADEVRERIKKVRAAADYPIIIMTDAESGMGEYKIGKHNAIGCTGSEKHAYAFGKTVGMTAREFGYNTVCDPVMDRKENGSARLFGSDKYQIARLAAAEARGFHDAGILTVGKHYPSCKYATDIDTHMAEGFSDQTEDELVDYSLYAYLELMKEGLLDGIMASHQLLKKIDPDNPATLSKPVIDVIRKRGYEGFIITDALCMMGIRAKFGRVEPMGKCIEAGCDLAMMYDADIIFNYNSLRECYERGILTDDALDAAVRHILSAQHKVFLNEQNEYSEITPEEHRLSKDIEYDSIFAKCDDGLSTSLPKNGKYYFALMIDNQSSYGKDDKVAVDTFSEHWHNPKKISEKILELFPGSKIQVFYQFPTQLQCARILEDTFGYDELIFVTYSEFLAYTGAEHFTHRVVTLIEAMQYTNRISTLVHFGNPVIIGELPHVSRIIIGGGSFGGTMASLEVLAGEREAKGVLTYKVDFK